MFDPYATHIAPLTQTALASEGDILELGCGNYSTPILSAIARHRGDRLVVKTSAPEWGDKFRSFADVDVIDWATWVPEGQWGMIFLDNEQITMERIKWLPLLARHTRTIVMHDADAARQHGHYADMVRGFKDVKIYKQHTPWTSVMTC